MALYKESHKRITFDVPIHLKELIHSVIPPSTLSNIMRNLLVAIIRLYETEGASKSLRALLNNKIKIVITEERNES